MSGPRGSAIETRQRILEAARDLFAQHGVDGVSVRDIASAAGVTHPLVHRYFGTKRQMVSEIVRNEGARAVALATGAASGEGPRLPASLEAITLRALTEAQTTIRILTRSEMDGLGVEGVFEEASSPFVSLMGWLTRQNPSLGMEKIRMIVVAYGAALFGFNAVGPWLLQEVGLQRECAEELSEQVADMLVQMVMAMAEESPGGKQEREGGGE